MKVTTITVLACFFLVSCNPRKHYQKIIQDLGYIAYRTALEDVGTGTIIKGQPKNLMVYTKPERCVPNKLENGTPTNIRFVSNTELPQSVKEVKVNFSTDLSFFGSTGNPLFTVNAGATYVKQVSAKFSDAKVEFIDEMAFWSYYDNHMSEDCKSALLKFPLFWKALKVDKMEFTFKNEAGGNIKLAAPMIKDIVSINVDVNWSLKDEYTLVITTPKYIGFFAVQLTEEAVRTHQATRYSNSVDKKENYVWHDIKAKNGKPNVLPLLKARPM